MDHLGDENQIEAARPELRQEILERLERGWVRMPDGDSKAVLARVSLRESQLPPHGRDGGL